LPKNKLWVTVFRDEQNEIPEDSKAADIWGTFTNIDPAKIRFFGRKDNFWEMGETGPCGPCTEIHIDRGIDFCDKQHIPGHICEVNGDCRRFVELWNLVFIQYNRLGPHHLENLPARHVDTGMGFERVTSVIQDVASNYDTDLFMPIIDAVQSLSGQNSTSFKKNIHAYRVIADHIRASSFLLADGILPSNEWSGYVLRRIIRRAVRFGTKIGFQAPFLYKAAEVFINDMSPVYPELADSAAHIASTLRSEEKRFFNTLVQGLPKVNELISSTQKADRSELPGEEVFKLYDTYGFPVDITREIAVEANLSIDEKGFEQAMENQRKRARSAWKNDDDPGPADIWHILAKEVGKTRFTGFKTLTESCCIKALVQSDKRHHTIDATDNNFYVIIDPSPFYAESGGQVGDIGILESPSARVRVLNTKNLVKNLPVLECRIIEGSITVDDVFTARVNEASRKATCRNHTATHLLQKALREILGDHIKQSGSLVTPDRLRFDFTHYTAVSRDDLKVVEQIINKTVLANLQVTTSEMDLDEALNSGIIALFGERYDEKVRVVRIGEISAELCGGTHVAYSGEIGMVKILSESSISAGVRRIEAVTGMTSLKRTNQWEDLIIDLAKNLKSPVNSIPDRVEKLQNQTKILSNEIIALQKSVAHQEIKTKLEKPEIINGIRTIIHHLPELPSAQLRDLADQVRQELQSGLTVLATTGAGKVFLIAAVTKDLTSRLHAGKIVGEVAKIVGGGGGGRPDMAQAGGTKPANLQKALEAVPGIVKKLMS
ncbi:alanine--tRNA ligase, partial [bacterium]|nr:alanine--tRNA ligase [bacterium]